MYVMQVGQKAASFEHESVATAKPPHALTQMRSAMVWVGCYGINAGISLYLVQPLEYDLVYGVVEAFARVAFKFLLGDATGVVAAAWFMVGCRAFRYGMAGLFDAALYRAGLAAVTELVVAARAHDAVIDDVPLAPCAPVARSDELQICFGMFEVVPMRVCLVLPADAIVSVPSHVNYCRHWF